MSMFVHNWVPNKPLVVSFMKPFFFAPSAVNKSMPIAQQRQGKLSNAKEKKNGYAHWFVSVSGTVNVFETGCCAQAPVRSLKETCLVVISWGTVSGIFTVLSVSRLRAHSVQKEGNTVVSVQAACFQYEARSQKNSR